MRFNLKKVEQTIEGAKYIAKGLYRYHLTHQDDVITSVSLRPRNTAPRQNLRGAAQNPSFSGGNNGAGSNGGNKIHDYKHTNCLSLDDACAWLHYFIQTRSAGKSTPTTAMHATLHDIHFIHIQRPYTHILVDTSYTPHYNPAFLVPYYFRRRKRLRRGGFSTNGYG